MRDNKLVLGYIGNGKSCNRYHLPFVLQRPDKFIVKTIFNPTIKHDVWNKVPNVIYTENIEDILNDVEIDMVIVCTHHKLHYQYSKLILESNKHCLCEKPFMENSKQAREIFDLANKNNLYCSAYQNRRYDSDFLTTQKVIESGKLGDLIELEMHYDYYRPYVPEETHEYNPMTSYLYGHGCHTLDQVISYFGKPDSIHYDVRQLLGLGRMNDYFDIDMYYGTLKVSVKSSYFRVIERPSFIVYGKKGMFVKNTKDRQEEHLKLFHMPHNKDFGIDLPEHYGVLTYYDDLEVFHEEKVPTVKGDYARVYDDIYECIVNNKPQVIKQEETMLQMEILENGVSHLK